MDTASRSRRSAGALAAGTEGGEVISHRRPCESRARYAAASRFGTVADGFRYNRRWWLWVPAFAGTTHRVTPFAHNELSQIQFSNGVCSSTRLRDLAALSTRVFLQIVRPRNSEGAGKAGWPMHPQPRVRNKTKHERSHHRFTE